MRTRREFLRDGSLAALGLGVGARFLAGCGDDSNKALDELAHRMSGAVLRPGDDAYGPASLPANGRFARIRPMAVARCSDSRDVATAVRWAREFGVAPTVRGGGHSYAGFSTTDGLLIDVSSLNDVHVDAAAGTVTMGGAALNRDMFANTVDSPFFLPGGTCLGVGFGGLTLGGGIGYNAHWAGLTSDHLTSTRIVDARGNELMADPAENADVFWACRGGAGGNFGVNTEFTFELLDTPRTDVSYYRFDWTGADLASGVLHAFDRLLTTAPPAFNAVARAVATDDTDVGVNAAISVMSRGQYIGPVDELRDLVAPLLAIGEPDESTVESLSFWDAQRIFASENAEHHSWGDISRYASDAIPTEAVDDVVQLLTECPFRSEDTNGSIWSLGWIGGDVMDAFERTETAYVHRGMHTLWRPTTVWPNSADESVAADLTDWSKAMIAILDSNTPRESYQNFPNRDLTDHLNAYYAENLPRLIDVKTRIDPDDIFSNAHGIPVR